MCFMGAVADKTVIARCCPGAKGEAEARLFADRGANLCTDRRARGGGPGGRRLDRRRRPVRAPTDISDRAAWDAGRRDRQYDVRRRRRARNTPGSIWVKALLEETAVQHSRDAPGQPDRAVLGIQAVAEPMRERGGGLDRHVSSTAGVMGYPATSPTARPSGGCAGSRVVAALELSDAGIRVNCVLLPRARSTRRCRGIQARGMEGSG